VAEAAELEIDEREPIAGKQAVVGTQIGMRVGEEWPPALRSPRPSVSRSARPAIRSRHALSREMTLEFGTEGPQALRETGTGVDVARAERIAKLPVFARPIHGLRLQSAQRSGQEHEPPLPPAALAAAGKDLVESFSRPQVFHDQKAEGRSRRHGIADNRSRRRPSP